MIFGMAFYCFQTRLDEVLAPICSQLKVPTACGGVFSSAIPEDKSVGMPTFMDDFALPIMCDSALELLTVLPSVSRVVAAVAQAFALTVNCSPGKTEALIRLAGCDKAAASALLSKCQ